MPAGVIPQDGVLVSSRPRLNSALGGGKNAGACAPGRVRVQVGTAKAGGQAKKNVDESRRRVRVASFSVFLLRCLGCPVWARYRYTNTTYAGGLRRVCAGSTVCVCVCFVLCGRRLGERERERLVPDWHACTRTVKYTTATVPLWKG